MPERHEAPGWPMQASIAALRNLAAHGPADELHSRKALDYLVLADGVRYAVEAKAASPPVSGQ